MPLGVLLALLSYSLYSCGDALVESFSAELGVFEIGFFANLDEGTTFAPEGALSGLFYGGTAEQLWSQIIGAGVAIIYSFFVEHYVSGLTAGAVKQ